MMLRVKTYRILTILVAVLAVAGTAALLWFDLNGRQVETGDWVAVGVALFCLIFFSPTVLVHEGGHLLFGLLAGMRFPAVTVGHFTFSLRGVRFSRAAFAAGESAFYPARPNRIKGKLAFTALGGGVMNFLYGGALLALYFLLPSHPALLFFALFAPLSLQEGFAAFLPCELPAGRTDGALLVGLKERAAFAEVTLAVLRAQSVVRRGSYQDIAREQLFSLPVLREDDPAFLALLQLRWRYQLSVGEETAALDTLFRLESLAEYLPPQTEGELLAELALVRRALGKGRGEGAQRARGAYFDALACLDGQISRREAEKSIKKEPLYGERELILDLLERAFRE